MAPPGYAPYQTAPTRHFASFGARFGAVLVDGIVLFLISIPFDVVGWLAVRKALENCFRVDVGDRTEIRCPNGALQGGWLAAAIGLFILGWVVAMVIYCRKVSRGQSWGHKALGIRIVDARTNTTISATRVFARQICRIFSQLFCFLGYLWMLWDDDSQTWHDKIVNTVVIDA